MVVTDTAPTTLLIVDDDATLRDRLAQAVRQRGYEVHTASSCDEALVVAQREEPEMALIDLRMPEGSGLQLIHDLTAIDPQTRIVVLTGYGSIATAIDAIRLGALHYLQKPADADEILAAFERSPSAPFEGIEPEFDPPSLERVKWEHINRVMADCGNNVSHAARRLQLHRRTLQRILQKYPPAQ